MKKAKAVLLIFLMIAAFYTLYCTVNKIIQSKPYAISVLEEETEAGNIGGRNGIRWKYG